MEDELTTKVHRRQKDKTITTKLEDSSNNDTQIKRKFQWGSGLNDRMDITGKFIKNISELPSYCTNPNEEQTEIQEFFNGVNVFITGGTGFMGKLLIEKLLVTCPNIGKLYIVIRDKKGQTSQERFNSLFEDKVFSRLHQLVPDFRKKIIVVAGDVSKPNLGMSDSDYETIYKNVSVIFHGAANVRFDEPLKNAVDINIIGVIEILKLARKCERLKSIMHVSTVYANCTALNSTVKEEFYSPAYEYKKLLELVEKEPDDVLEKNTKKFISPWPNTYSYTKQIAENVIQKEAYGLPIAILRPGIIVATYNEPIRGWTDNVYGPTGIIVGAGTGVLRVIQIDKEVNANLVPVDFVVNALIAAALKTSKNFESGKRNIEIYNYVSTTRNPIRWGEFSYWNGFYGRNYPTVLAIWYEEFHPIRTRLLFLTLAFFLHTLPSYLCDAILLLCGKKPRMIKLYQKINKFNDILSYFSTNEWKFKDDNVFNLWKGLSDRDKAVYPFDIEECDWDYHAQAHLLGLRVYLVKDDINTLELGRKKWKRLRFFHRSLQVFLLLAFTWIVYRGFSLANSLIDA